jgi:hypothetical protein
MRPRSSGRGFRELLVGRRVAASLVILASAGGSAQEPGTPSPTPRGVQERYEPPAGPGVGQAFLETFEGDWSVERNFYPPSGGAPTRATGECAQRMVQDGRFLESRFTFHVDGKTTTGTGISGFDPQTGLFTTFWFDSRSTRFSVRQSREPFDGKQIVLYSVSLGGSGTGRTSRTVTHMENEGNRIVHRQFNSDAGGKERLLMELVMNRR